MRLLTFHTPLRPSGLPDPEPMAKLGAFMEETFKSGDRTIRIVQLMDPSGQ